MTTRDAKADFLPPGRSKEQMLREATLRRIFMPDLAPKFEELETSSSPQKFVYYTTATTAFQILQSNEIWLRNATVMNDASEIKHGFRELEVAYASDAGKDFKSAIDDCYPGAAVEVRRWFDAFAQVLLNDTFIACFSRHRETENLHGRLSMWRAYGNEAGVGLVFNGRVFAQETTGLGAYVTPITYGDQEVLKLRLSSAASAIRANIELLRREGFPNFVNWPFQMFRFAAIATKHIGFAEEDEWRIITNPDIEKTDLLKEELLICKGIPQRVLKLQLIDSPENRFDASLRSILDSVIIGPCAHPNTIKATLVQLLRNTGVRNPESRIVISGIPLRHGI